MHSTTKEMEVLILTPVLFGLPMFTQGTGAVVFRLCLNTYPKEGYRPTKSNEY
jgi:hypothetical protein